MHNDAVDGIHTTLVQLNSVTPAANPDPFYHAFAESENTPAAASRGAAEDNASTPPPVALPSHHASSDTALGAADIETPIGARDLPTPYGTMGRAALPPTPFAPGSVTPGLNSAAAAQLSSWRSRASNAAFKAKSPPTSRSSALLGFVLHVMYSHTVSVWPCCVTFPRPLIFNMLSKLGLEPCYHSSARLTVVQGATPKRVLENISVWPVSWNRTMCTDWSLLADCDC